MKYLDHISVFSQLSGWSPLLLSAAASLESWCFQRLVAWSRCAGRSPATPSTKNHHNWLVSRRFKYFNHGFKYFNHNWLVILTMENDGFELTSHTFLGMSCEFIAGDATGCCSHFGRRTGVWIWAGSVGFTVVCIVGFSWLMSDLAWLI